MFIRIFPIETFNNINFPQTVHFTNKFRQCFYRGADKSLARPNSQCILFDGEKISFDASLVIYIVLIFLQLLL